MDRYEQDCYRIERTFSGYESQSGETYYFDSLAVLKGYKCTWAMEGQSGQEYDWFDNGNISTMYEEIWGQQDEPDIKFITSSSDNIKLKKYQLDVQAIIRDIQNLIDQNMGNMTEDADGVKIFIEETNFYGFDFISKTEIYIDKTLYEKVLKY